MRVKMKIRFPKKKENPHPLKAKRWSLFFAKVARLAIY